MFEYKEWIILVGFKDEREFVWEVFLVVYFFFILGFLFNWFNWDLVIDFLLFDKFESGDIDYVDNLLGILC